MCIWDGVDYQRHRLAGAQRQFGAVERSARPITKQFLLIAYDKYVLPYFRKAAREIPGLLSHLENQRLCPVLPGPLLLALRPAQAWLGPTAHV